MVLKSPNCLISIVFDAIALARGVPGRVVDRTRGRHLRLVRQVAVARFAGQFTRGGLVVVDAQGRLAHAAELLLHGSLFSFQWATDSSWAISS